MTRNYILFINFLKAVITPAGAVLMHVIFNGFHYVITYLFSPLSMLMMFILLNFFIISASIEFQNSKYDYEPSELDDICVIPYFLSYVLQALLDDPANCLDTFSDEECLMSYKFVEVSLICVYYFGISNILDFVRIWKANTLVITYNDDVVGYITYDGGNWKHVMIDEVEFEVGKTGDEDNDDDDGQGFG
ncbi:hypothetical protein CAEBREN_19828 [Caenorhabditis brenneri]|uniref:Uncharacterized protein n=1 Tax=Caenorhabditis brenneri TaxID=135651 RepID=G0MNT3_CAEBE|nr:hypothetical protein CAEBREN_19828 [Caenorhabditis brenneri]